MGEDRKIGIHYSTRVVLLQSHAIWVEECLCYISMVDDSHFKSLIGLTEEFYIDDIVIKSKNCFEHLHHLEEAFKLMCKHDMKLNSLKCVFRVSMGKFLEFITT